MHMKTLRNIFTIAAIGVLTSLCLLSCTSKDQLKIAVEIAATECPMDCGDGTVCTDMSIENGNVVYVYEMDEERYNIEGCKDPLIQASMKTVFLENSQNSGNAEIEEFLKIVKESNADIICRYVGNVSGDGFDIIIDNSEL